MEKLFTLILIYFREMGKINSPLAQII